MAPELPTPGTIIARHTAEAYPCATAIAQFWNHCADHAVTTCHSCNNIWRLDQLRRKCIGYYPGEPRTVRHDLDHAPTAQPAPELAPGNRYALTCPIDGSDVTAMSLLHQDLCKALDQIHPTRPKTPDLDK